MTDSPKSTLGLPYSTIRRVEDYYYISGHIGMDLVTKIAAPDIKDQTIRLFKNLESTLKIFELDFNDIIKTTVFLTNVDDFTGMNEVYITYFADPTPARTTVPISELPRVANVPLKVELEAIAYKKS